MDFAQYNSADTSRIESIADSRATTLAQLGIHVIPDLLRISAHQLHRRFARNQSRVSLSQVKSWKQMAYLLAVKSVTPQWAEALVKHKINSIDDLSHADIDLLNKIFEQAKLDNIIPDTPTTSQCATMIQDATVLSLTAWSAGTVENADGQGVAGAQVNIGNVHTQTDSQGRFRLWKIPMNNHHPLQISHPTQGQLSLEAAKIHYDKQLISVERYQLLVAATTAPLTFSELTGDSLPLSDNMRVVTEAISPSQLRKDDIMVLRRFYKTSDDVQLVSKFKAVAEGKVIVYKVKYPLDQLSSDVAVGDYFKVKDQQLTAIEMTPKRLQRIKRFRQFDLHKSAQAKPKTTQALDQWISDYFTFTQV